jgi:AraC-like DNA-binding protein
MDRRIKAVLTLLQQEWRNTVRVCELASRFNLGTSQLEHLFKRDTKMSIRDFVRGRRLAEAARMLAGSEEPVSAISYRAGFPDVSNFNHAFKKHYGMSPRQYRDRQFGCSFDQEIADPTK